MKDNESRSLWATYLDSTKQGVAIKTNVGNLFNQLNGINSALIIELLITGTNLKVKNYNLI